MHYSRQELRTKTRATSSSAPGTVTWRLHDTHAPRRGTPRCSVQWHLGQSPTYLESSLIARGKQLPISHVFPIRSRKQGRSLGFQPCSTTTRKHTRKNKDGKLHKQSLRACVWHKSKIIFITIRETRRGKKHEAAKYLSKNV